jgi:hypothetical protein
MNPKRTPDYAHMRTQLGTDLVSLPGQERENEMYIFDMMVGLRGLYDNMFAAKKKLDSTLAAAVSEKQKGNVASGTLDNILDAYSEISELSRKSGSDWDKPHAPAFIVVLAYDDSNPSHKKNVYNGVWFSQKVKVGTPEFRYFFRDTAYQDGAVLIDRNGYVVAKNIQLTANPHEILKSANYRRGSSGKGANALGFKDPHVNTRHNSALAASHEMEGTVIYTLGEETGHIRRMQGRITHSTAEPTGYSAPKIGYLSRLKQAIFACNPIQVYQPSYARRAGTILPQDTDATKSFLS